MKQSNLAYAGRTVFILEDNSKYYVSSRHRSKEAALNKNIKADRYAIIRKWGKTYLRLYRLPTKFQHSLG